MGGLGIGVLQEMKMEAGRVPPPHGVAALGLANWRASRCRGAFLFKWKDGFYSSGAMRKNVLDTALVFRVTMMPMNDIDVADFILADSVANRPASVFDGHQGGYLTSRNQDSAVMPFLARDREPDSLDVSRPSFVPCSLNPGQTLRRVKCCASSCLLSSCHRQQGLFCLADCEC